MPSLYAADVSLGKPKKIANAPAQTDDQVEAKPKRQMSEETKRKLQEARARKKMERLQQAQEEAEAARKEQEAQEAAEAAALAKKQAAAQRRKEARERKKLEQAIAHEDRIERGLEPAPEETETKPKKGGKRKPPTPPPSSNASVSEEEAEPAQKPKRQRKSKVGQNEDHPPQWFTKFVTSIMAEKKEQQGVKASKKEIRHEGEKAAEEKWAEPITRERIRTAMDGHLGQMYSMIFG